jgi:hypothetical protein
MSQVCRSHATSSHHKAHEISPFCIYGLFLSGSFSLYKSMVAHTDIRAVRLAASTGRSATSPAVECGRGTEHVDLSIPVLHGNMARLHATSQPLATIRWSKLMIMHFSIFSPRNKNWYLQPKTNKKLLYPHVDHDQIPTIMHTPITSLTIPPIQKKTTIIAA